MSNPAWFETFRSSENYKLLQKKPLAYFCIEYALSPSLPTYAGGLGVLAGDFIKELSEQHIPAVAVGLYYQSKYGADTAAKIEEQKAYPVTPQQQGLLPVYDNNGTPLLVKIPIQDHDVFAKVWLWKQNSIPVYLLDTDVSQNSPEDRAICFKLYDSNKETRLKQEMVLGIGGYRLLEALHIEPSLFHMNEGHSSLLTLEIIRHEMQKRKLGFKDAVALSTHHVIFTNHTLLAAGSEIYHTDLFTTLLSSYATQLEVPVSDIVALGLIPESNSFSLSLFALRLAGKINAVSELHAKEATKAWGNFSVEAVTNGIHVPTWNCIPKDSSLSAAHIENKKRLLGFLKEQTEVQWEDDELLIGWARRMVRYKRPLALFGEIDRLVRIVNTTKTPVRIVIAGIAHQGDDEGREFIKVIQEVIKERLPHVAVYLPNYTVTLAKLLTSGCDVWLNTPVVGSEACGTSGMKACLNGVLPCTTKDGWVDEVDLSHIGWELNNDTIHDSLLDTLEDKIIPLYYASDKSGWETYMRNARELISTQFSTTRMLEDYFEKMYLPILTASVEHYSV